MAAARKLFEEFIEKTGLDGPGFEDNVATMQFDDMVVNFYIDDEGGEVGMFMGMCQAPVDADERLSLYSNVLKLNLLGHDTGGGVLGVDEDDGQISFSRFLSVEGMDLPEFERELELFLGSAESLLHRISGPEADAGGDAGSVDPEEGGDSAPPVGGMRV